MNKCGCPTQRTADKEDSLHFKAFPGSRMLTGSKTFLSRQGINLKSCQAIARVSIVFASIDSGESVLPGEAEMLLMWKLLIITKDER
jgi:hypothetical protein